MKIPHKVEWYFWHHHYPNYEERMQVMAHYAANSRLHRYHLAVTLELVPKD